MTAYWLTDVLLETGRVQEENRMRTKTDLFQLLLRDGHVAAIEPNDTVHDQHPRVSAQGALALPAFIERHIHLDKTLLGGPWMPTRPARSILERVAIEAEILNNHPVPIEERARQFLGMIQRAGSTHVRTHVDIAPAYGLRHLEAVKRVLTENENNLTYEIVAFPQHGLLRSSSQELTREAMKLGATLVGGVDPGTVDLKLERSLEEMVSIAVEFGAGIDLHLHDRGQLGLYTIRTLADMIEQAGLQGKVAISHAFALADADTRELASLAERFVELGISINSSVPLSIPMPLYTLHKAGVHVALGCDNVYDSWSPFGTGDIFERANRLAETQGMVQEEDLAEALAFITGGLTPVNAQGEQQWPRLGQPADLVLVEASCSAEAVARRAPRRAVLHRGKTVAG
uniref:Deaminase n=1 Tax=Thermosporothrix sp. COM3 TaxID=2490863 RepID=A0A455SN50_9CHLR|nr:deaminase [Thermosporothrix sp. COM3]